jgi:hypothetical protein
MSYEDEEEDTCMSYEEEDVHTTQIVSLRLLLSYEEEEDT